MLLYSIQPQVRGKSNQHLLGSGWRGVETDRRDFVETNFINGIAITAGHFDTDQRHDAGWQRANLLVVDIDEYPEDGTDWSLERVLEDPFIQEFCFAAFPSSRFDYSQPKLHLYFEADRVLEDKELYRAASEFIRGMISIPTDPALSKPSQAVYGTVFQKIKIKKSFDCPLLYFNPDAPLINTEGIEVDHSALWAGADVLPQYMTVRSKTLSARAKEHNQQPEHMKERITLEALEYALRGWGRRSHEDWKALLMSSYRGSNSPKVAQAIMQSEEVEWRPGEQAAIPAWWNTHEPWQEGGYTVATLFMLARDNGWLTETTADIGPGEAEEFYAEHAGDFLVEKQPTRALVISNTGTGKTLGAIQLLKHLGIPKSVFFAPSIKLCINLSATLERAGVGNTLYIDNGITKDADTLRDAHVLVTTLQTFGTKLINSGVDVSSYGLVVMDESDDLFQSFVLAGTQVALRTASHVTKEQARLGLIALQRVFSEVKHVLMLDGTATKLSIRMAEAFTTEPLHVYRNTYKRDKAPVYLLDTLDEARDKFMTSVKEGKKVVLVVDTKREARLMEQAVYTQGSATEDEVVCITGQNLTDEYVADFFHDVEEGAKKYRVVIYNSAMGVGVSIVDTKPDVIVQVASFINPRKNLQMLNRYRQQSEVWCYVPPSESLYNETFTESLERLKSATAYEFGLFNLPAVYGDRLAQTVAELALLAATDIREQIRARQVYYIQLLKEDGRKVSHSSGRGLDKATLAEARDILKHFQEEVKAGWQNVAPIDRNNPPAEGATPLEIAQGILHAQVARIVPEYASCEIDNLTLADLALTFGKYVQALESLYDTDALLDRARKDARDSVSLTGRRFHLSRMDLIGLLGLLFDSTNTRLTDAELAQRAPLFNIEVARRQPTYDTIAGYRNSFEKMQMKHEDPAELALALSKEILKGLGLKLGKSNGAATEDGGRERITKFRNADEAVLLLSLRGHDVDTIKFDHEATQELFAYTQRIGPALQKMSRDARNAILDEGQFVL